MEIPLQTPVNEGCWEEGRSGEQIKVLFAMCLLDVLGAKFCCYWAEHGGRGGPTSISHWGRNPPPNPFLKDNGVFAG